MPSVNLTELMLDVMSRGLLKYTYELNTKANVLDSKQQRMVVGDKYEIYIPIAKRAGAELGLRFTDDVGYTFTYAGSVEMDGTEYIASPDVRYSEEEIRNLSPKLTALLTGSNAPVCPAFVATKFVRPVTL